MAESGNVVIYCDHLLYPSETFIAAQAGALKRYAAKYAGLRRVKGLELPNDAVFLVNNGTFLGSLRETMFKLFGVAPRFVRTLASLKPCLVHAHFGADGYRALSAVKHLNVPLIVTFHGSDATVTETRGRKVPYGHRRYLAHRSDLQAGASQFIAVSQFIKRKLLEQGFPEDKVRVHYIGVDTELFSPAQNKPEQLVLFVGRLTERKGVDYLIRAMAKVQAVLPSLELVLIGDGHLRAELEMLAAATLKSFRFLGTQPPEQVREWIRKSLLFAAPSISIESGEEEGLGMVFLEAQAMQKPVVSFASGGIVEAVEHGVTGLLTSERDWQGLARDILLLAQDPEMRSEMGARGRSRVLRHFDLKRQTAVLEELYFEVAERFRCAAASGLSKGSS